MSFGSRGFQQGSRMRASLLGCPIDALAMARECEIAIVLVGHGEFKMVPLAQRRRLDVIDTRGTWQDMPVRT